MATITPSFLTLESCFSNYYALPYFQREYKWDTKHFGELVNDLQQAFTDNYEVAHGRMDVANYKSYFLGSIITADGGSGKTLLIDGQQRLTSCFIFLSYLWRLVNDKAITGTTDVTPLLYSLNYGSADYKLEFSNTRKAIFDKYRNTSLSESVALAEAEEIQGLDNGDLKILEALRAMQQLIDPKVEAAIPFFIDYLLKKVGVIAIFVSDEPEAQRVFVTMNDRGLRLGPIELLKGRILSAITNDADRQKAHDSWHSLITNLKALDPEEDSLFFRHLFRGLWGSTMRRRGKNALAGDFDLIGDAYHRWFENNLATLGLNTADDYLSFVQDKLAFYAKVYQFIKKGEEEILPGFDYLYYNAARKYSFQPMVIMAAINPVDTDTIWKDKIKLVSRYIDYILTTRTIDNKSNNYDNVKELSFNMAKSVRGMDYTTLLAYIRGDWPAHAQSLNNFSQVKYNYSERSDILYLLARIALYLQDSFQLTNKLTFEAYWQRDRGGRTFDIEHLLKEQFDVTALPSAHAFVDSKDYAVQRNMIGALILLPRSRNRSLQDKSYKEKCPAYSTEDILSQTLCNDLYQNNPNVNSYVSANPGLGIIAIPDFGRNDITLRGNMYTEIAKLIWQMP